MSQKIPEERRDTSGDMERKTGVGGEMKRLR